LPIQVPDIPYNIQNIPCIESKYGDYLEREKSVRHKNFQVICEEISDKIEKDKKEIVTYIHHFFLSCNLYLAKLIDTSLSSSYSINDKLEELKEAVQKHLTNIINLEKSLIKQRAFFEPLKRHDHSFNRVISSINEMIVPIKEAKKVIENKNKEISFVFKNSSFLKNEGYAFKALTAYNSVINDVLKQNINPIKAVYDDEILFVFNAKFDVQSDDDIENILDKQLELEDVIHEKVLSMNKEFVGNVVISWNNNLDC